MKLNILWRGTIREFIGIGYEMTTKKVGGVDTLHSMIEASKWWEDIQVSFGEEGNYVKILGGWFGEKEDLFSGKSSFIESDRLWSMIEHEIQDLYNQYCEDKYRADEKPLTFARWQYLEDRRVRKSSQEMGEENHEKKQDCQEQRQE